MRGRVDAALGHGCPFQSVSGDDGLPFPPPDVAVRGDGVLVKIVLASTESMALDWSSCWCRRDAKETGLGIDGVETTVRAGLHPAISSPTVSTFQPSSEGTNIASSSCRRRWEAP